jgi:hypothetical protein
MSKETKILAMTLGFAMIMMATLTGIVGGVCSRRIPLSGWAVLAIQGLPLIGYLFMGIFC